jgi:hypothetical protein
VRFLAVPLRAEDGAGFSERGGDCANPGTHTGSTQAQTPQENNQNASESKLIKPLIDLLYLCGCRTSSICREDMAAAEARQCEKQRIKES